MEEYVTIDTFIGISNNSFIVEPKSFVKNSKEAEEAREILAVLVYISFKEKRRICRKTDDSFMELQIEIDFPYIHELFEKLDAVENEQLEKTKSRRMEKINSSKKRGKRK